jgi:hypothetical protein
MKAYAIDTNVLLVANEAPSSGPQGRTPQASAKCVLSCVRRLRNVQQSGKFALDSLRLVLREYQAQRLSFAGQPGFGDAFFKWVFDHQANPQHCELATITRVGASDTDFEEFPDDPELADFDPSDRKFVAIVVALGCDQSAILNAVDSDWWDHREVLSRNGIEVEFVCPDQFSHR